MATLRSAALLALPAALCAASAVAFEPEAAFASAAGAAAAASAAVPASAARQLQTRTNVWTSERQGNQNAGNVGGTGPGSSPAPCRTWLLGEEDPEFGAPGNLLSSGVSSTAASPVWAHYAGDELGFVWIFGETDVYLSYPMLDARVSSLTGIEGFFSSPAATISPLPPPNGTAPGTPTQDLIVVPALDGHVYALSQVSCMDWSEERKAQGWTIETMRAAAQARAAAGAGSEDEEDVDGLGLGFGPKDCIQWVFASPTNGAFAGAPRIAAGQGVVFVTETDPNLATAGVLRALNLTTGQETVWPNKTAYVASYQGENYPLLGVVPATSPLTAVPDSQLILAFGPKLVIINASTGTEITAIDTYTDSGNCYSTGETFASSVAVKQNSPTSATLYIQSESGNLWAYTLEDTGAGSTPSLSCLFACEYFPGTANCMPQAKAKARVEAAAAALAAAEAGGDAAAAAATLALASAAAAAEAEAIEPTFVPGGWYHSTTKAQRAELHAAIRAAHAAVYGSGSEQAVAVTARYGVGGLWAGRPITDEALEVAALARQLPKSVLETLTTPSGYVRLGTNGKPAVAGARLGDIFGSTLTRSTPAISSDGTKVAFTTFGDGVSNSVNGIIIANANDGSLPGLNWMLTSGGVDVNGDPIAYARSRSSPAWDGQGFLYVAADWDFSNVAGNGDGTYNDTVPSVVAITFANPDQPTIAWSVDVGREGDGPIGLASPVLTDGQDPTVHRLMMSGTDASFIQVTGCGMTCPSGNNIQICSGHGDCDGTTGLCSCYPAYSQDNMCYKFIGCDHGRVDFDGFCDCDTCFRQNANGTCSIPYDCMNGGYCKVVNKTIEQCSCPWCYGLDPDSGLCTVGPSDCGPNSIGCSVNDCICAPCFVLDDAGENCVPQDCGNGQCTNNGGVATCTCNNCYTPDPDSGSCTVLQDCGPGGTCDPVEGVCENNGDQCWLYDRVTGRYDTYQTCANHGSCNDLTGHCTCQAGWSNMSIPTPCSSCDACHTGKGTCSQEFSCSGNGVCTLGPLGPTHRVCICNPGWTGPMCESPVSDNAPAGVSPAVAAGVGVPVALLGAAALGFYLVRMRRGPSYAKLGGSMGGGSAGLGATGSGVGKIPKGAATDRFAAMSGSAAPKSFSTISKTAGYGTDGAKAAVDRLSALGGGGGGGGLFAGSTAKEERSSLLSAAKVQASKGSGYGGF